MAVERAHEPAFTLRHRRHFVGRLVTLAGFTGAALALTTVRLPLQGSVSHTASATGERRLVHLPDGSELLLNARSRADVRSRPGHHEVHLLAGSVSLRAAPVVKHPLVVVTEQGTVTGSGAHFMVRQEPGRTLAVALRQDVQIALHAGATQRLAAGSGVRFDHRFIDGPRVDLLDEAAWQTGVIQVSARPLLHVINALRPYHPGVLRISNAAGALIVTGRFALDDVDQTLKRLDAGLPIVVRTLTPWMTWIDMAST